MIPNHLLLNQKEAIDFGGIILNTAILLSFILFCFVFRVKACAQGGEGQRKRERENLKQAPHHDPEFMT